MKRKIFLLIIPILFYSCNKWIAPPYTSVSKMLEIDKGMSPEEVDTTLGIKPYNIIHRDDSIAIFEYNYRLKNREVQNISKYSEFIQSERSQTAGNNYFSNASKFYLIYKHDSVSTLFTGNWLANTDYRLVNYNNMSLLSQNKLVDFNLIIDTTYLYTKGDWDELNKKSRYKHTLLYAPVIPYGIIGFKYVINRRFGGYASFASSVEYVKVTYLTTGFVWGASSQVNFYFGAGLGPYWYHVYNSFTRESEMQISRKFAFEIGNLLQLNLFALDYSVGYCYKGFFLRFGIGVCIQNK